MNSRRIAYITRADRLKMLMFVLSRWCDEQVEKLQQSTVVANRVLLPQVRAQASDS